MRLRRGILFGLLSWMLFWPAVPQLAQAEEPRVTPLGTKLPVPDLLTRNENPPVLVEGVAEVIRKAVEAYGGRDVLDSVRDSVAAGRLTFFAIEGPKSTFDVTVVRQGNSQIQRTIKHLSGELRQGSDGKIAWESFNGMTRSVLGGLVGSFIESQTTRSPATLFDSQREGVVVRDLGMKGDARILEVEIIETDKPGRKTRYSVDKKTSRVTRVEWITGETTTMFGAVVPTTEAYVLSDFRKVQGIVTPFEIERYVNGIKIEETRFSTVRYNAAPKDGAFQP